MPGVQSVRRAQRRARPVPVAGRHVVRHRLRRRPSVRRRQRGADTVGRRHTRPRRVHRRHCQPAGGVRGTWSHTTHELTPFGARVAKRFRTLRPYTNGLQTCFT